ncbi:M23 family metallopeptidase [Treponema parvum]|uniref:M23 family metallopeptidase n=1 Tax=Treponema parvum TaxID=138851 RepID=A0A975IBK1_9SPIR|nr:M23 family metallopeptidase [Treponema parvum]QTQ10857.1 M23 family metallopeptidase [Treponema parvum]
MADSKDSHTNAIRLGHEAYRDGIIGTTDKQRAETIAAVMGHTEMAVRMLDYAEKSPELQRAILGNENILNDIGAYYSSRRNNDDLLFDNYVNGNYDSSGDYWKVLCNGNIEFDGNFDLYDENGKLLHRYENISGENGGYTDALAESLNLSYEEAASLINNAYTWNENEKKYVQKKEDSIIKTSDNFKAKYDFQVNFADNVINSYHGNMQTALEAYKQNIKNGDGLVDYSSLSKMDLSEVESYAKEYNKYISAYYDEKLNRQYNSPDAKSALKEVERLIDKGKFTGNEYVYNAFGEGGILNPLGQVNAEITTYAYYKDGKAHGWGIPRGFALDLANGEKGDRVYSVTNTFLYSNSVNSNIPLNLGTGNEVRLFGNNNSVIYGHLLSESTAMNSMKNLSSTNVIWRSLIPAGTQIGNIGNTGNSSGPHLHFEYRKKYQFWRNRNE